MATFPKNRWQKPRRFDRNLLVIGAGAAGLVSASIGVAAKARVTLVESRRMGGDCLNYGCVPSKTLIRSARLAHQIRQAAEYGLAVPPPEIRFTDVMARVQEVIARIAPHDSIERYTALGVEVLQGHACLVDPWTVDIQLNSGGTQRLTSRRFIIAAGASPRVPDLPGLEEVGYVTSDTLWEAFARLPAAPPRLLVLGGGPIGCELAQAFARLGSQVTQIDLADRLLATEDEEVSALAKTALEQSGVQVLTACKALRCEREGKEKFIVVAQQGETRRLAFDELICATGRVARLQGYGLEQLGIATRNTVVTNDYLQTVYPHIYAAGDVAGPYQFTHVAAHQAWYAAMNALFGSVKKFRVDYAVVPRVIFLDPEIARVGLNEQEARRQGIAYEITRYDLGELDRAIMDGSAQGFVKVLTVPGRDRILGVTLVGEQAGEGLAEFTLAMKHGLGLRKILGTLHAYPTLAEAGKQAAAAWQRHRVPAWLLRWLVRYHAWLRG